MRIYLCAPYAVRNELRMHAQELVNDGHECTSTWLTETHEIHQGTLGTAADKGEDYAQFHAANDLEDVARSDMLIVWSWPAAEKLLFPGTDMGPNSGGRHIETGYALACGIPVVVIGPQENIFHRGLCTVVDSWAEALVAIEREHNARFGITAESGSDIN